MGKKGRRSLVALTVMLFFTVGLIGAAAAGEVPRMTKEDLKAKLGDPNVVVIDVRTGSDWKASDMKIKGAVREEASKVDEWVPKLEKSKTIVLYCA